MAVGRSAPDPSWPPPPPGWRHDAPDPPDAFRVPFGVLDGIGLVLWTLLLQAFILGPLLVTGMLESPAVTLAALAGVQVLTLLTGAWWLRARGRLSWRLLGPVRPGWRHAALGAAAGLAGFVIVTLLLALATLAFGPLEQPEQQVLQDATKGLAAGLWSFVVAVLLAPALEEAVFRGVLFQAIRARLGLWPGIVLSAFAFAIVHLEVTQPIFSAALLLLGVWLAAVFHRTGSLVAAITAHATFNAIALGVTLATVGAAG